MKQVKQALTIHEAKTHLSRLVQRAKDGEVVYIGTYGKQEVMLVAARPQALGVRRLGTWQGSGGSVPGDGLVGPDAELTKLLGDSINRPLPGFHE